MPGASRPAAVLASIGLLVAQPARAESVPPPVVLEGGRLSLSAERMPLPDLLTSISSRDARISFAVQGDASHLLVSDSFRDIPLARALARVLSAQSHLLVDRDSGPAGRRIEVILLGAGVGSQVIQVTGHADTAGVAAEQPAEMLLSDAVSSASPARRASAAEALAYRGGSPEGAADYAGPLLQQMLSDPEEEVRARALAILKDTADELPFDLIAQVAREDASAARRIQALSLLLERAEQGEARGPLAIALKDSDPQVRRRARELMLDWHVDPNDG